MDNSTTSGSVGELKEESNLIIYIIGLILLIIWKVTVMCQVRLHLKHKRLEELVQQQQLYTEYTSFLLAVSNSQPSSMVNVFGESVGSGYVDLQLVKRVVATVADYIDEIQQSNELGFTSYRLHTNEVGTYVTPIRVYNGKVYVLADVVSMQVTNRRIATGDKSMLIYFVESDDGSGVALQGDRGPSGVGCLKGDSGGQGPSGRQGPAGKRGAVGSGGPPGKIGKIGPPGPVGSKGNVGTRGEKDETGNAGGAGPQGPVGLKGSTGLIGVPGVEGVRGVAGPDGPKGPSGEKGDRAWEGPPGIQGLVGNQGERGEHGQRGERGEKGVQVDASDVLSILSALLPIQLAEPYGEKMCFVKYHVSEDQSSVVRMTGGVQTLRNVSAYNEPTWHCDAQFVDKQGHTKANVQNASGHGHFVEMKNTAHHSPYDLVDNKVNAVYIVYKIRNYDGTGIEHNYLFSCGMWYMLPQG